MAVNSCRSTVLMVLAAVCAAAMVLGAGSPVRAQTSDAPAASSAVAAVPAEGSGGEAPEVPSAGIDTGDTAWVLVSAAMVLLMTPALAFFYGGLVRRKNVLSVLMQCMMILGVVSLQWVLFGYSLSFGPDIGGVIGSLAWAGLSGVDGTPNPTYAATIPHQAFMIFQAMFAVITPALIIGAYAERIRFAPFCLFSVLWATLVYDPVCHWVWADGGFIRSMGALDFAGGAVVHINAGMCALAAALFLGRRKGYPDEISPPHNLPFAVLGAGLLWFGWFGFNAGSALGASGVAAGAFVGTHIAAAAAAVTWSLCDWIFHKRPTVLGIITGAVAGLVAITPAAGFVAPLGAIAIGISSSVICWISVTFIKVKFGYDDSLDAFGVHGVGGIWGALATGLFATTAVNAAGADGLFYGNPGLVWTQTKGVAITMAYSFVASYALFWIVDKVARLRACDQDERVGLDLSQHREVGYTMLD